MSHFLCRGGSNVPGNCCFLLQVKNSKQVKWLSKQHIYSITRKRFTLRTLILYINIFLFRNLFESTVSSSPYTVRTSLVLTLSSSLILFLSQADLSASKAGSCRRPELSGGTQPCQCILRTPDTAAVPTQTDRTRSMTPGHPAPPDHPVWLSLLQKNISVPPPGRRPVPP